MRKTTARKTLGSSYALLGISHQSIFPNDGVGGCHLFNINLAQSARCYLTAPQLKSGEISRCLYRAYISFLK